MRPKDNSGNYFKYTSANFIPNEKEKIRSEINTIYAKYEGKRISIHYSYGLDDIAYKYYFENQGFDDINIF